MLKIKFCILIIFIISSFAFAQTNTQRSPLDPANWGVILDHPAVKNVTVKRDVTYLTTPAGAQTIDIYTPPGAKAGEKLPAVIFLNAIGDRPGDKVKNWGIYSSWPRLIAAHNMIGISMDADGERIQDSLRGLFDFLAKDGAKHGIDADRLGVYAASANVTQSSIYLMGEGASKGIKAAALFYGGVPNMAYRKDLPVLFIVAEGDMAGGIGQGVPGLWQKVIDAKAPWTVVFASRMPHAFDAFEDTDESRQHVMQAVAFWKTHLQSVPAPSWTPSPARAVVSSTYGSDFQKTADLLTKYIPDNPNDAQAHMLLGRSLQQLRRLDESVAAFERALVLDPTNMRAHGGIGQIRSGQRRYEEAVTHLTKAIDGGFRNSQTYGQLAFAQMGVGRNEDAIKSYESAFAAGIPPGANTRGLAYFNMACAYARLKQNDKAFEMLGKAVDEGFNRRATFETDDDLAPLRTDPRFAELLKRLPPMPAAG
jgi:tetratricopeptide (TPR) repeat protein